MAKDRDDLFKRLTTLFRGGPTVKRKVRAFRSPSASTAVDVFKKSYSQVYSNALNAYGQYDRMSRYADFSEMEYTPEIASALDIFSEEATSTDERGRVLHVFSENPKIEQILNELFHDTLNVEHNLPSWTRNLVKFGDVFLFNDIHPEYGVINVFPIPVNEVEREEGFDPSNPLSVRFRWITQGNQVLEAWQVSHFRLLGNDAFLPYGSSILESARRIWRQLILIEDAMLVYRVVRSPERRVFYIDVGTVPPEDVQNYLEAAQSKLKKSQVIDKSSGRVDLRYNPLSVDEDYFIPVRGGETGTKVDSLAGGQHVSDIADVEYIQRKLFSALKVPKAYLGYDESLCLTGDTPVPLLDGRTLSMQEVVAEFSSGKQNWTYSYDTKEGHYACGKIIDAWQTKEIDGVKEFLYEVKIDDGQVIRCTANHPFMLRDGTYKRADELQPNDSLMPLYRKKSSKESGDLIEGYDMILCDNKDGSMNWKYTHKEIYSAYVSNKFKIHKQRVIHHIDCNKHNNEPVNLQEMSWYEHRRWHAQNLQTTLFRPDVVAKREPRRIAALKSEAHRGQKRAQMKAQANTPGEPLYNYIHSDRISRAASKEMKRRWRTDRSYRAIKTRQNSEIWSRPEVYAKLSGENHWIRRKNVKHDLEWLITFCKENFVYTANQFRKDHKDSVSDISPVSIKYVMNLLFRSGYNNFADFRKSCLSFTAKRNHKVASVTKLTKELFPGIYQKPVPVYDLTIENYSNFAVGAGLSGVIVHNSSKATLAQEDIRFSRTIGRIQRVLTSELNKLAIIHLFTHGYTGEDLIDFSLHLSNPSAVAQQQKLELFRTRFEIAASAPDRLVDQDYIRKEVLGLSDDDINRIKEGLFEDQRLNLMIDAEDIKDDAASFGGISSSSPSGDELDDELASGEGDEEAASAEEEAEDEDLFASADVEMGGISLKDALDDDEEKKKGQGPVKTTPQIRRYLYNKSRRRTHGPTKTHMPDFKEMVKADSDPFDKKFFSGSPFKGATFGEGGLRDALTGDEFTGSRSVRPRVNNEMQVLLMSLEKTLNISNDNRARMLNEAIEEVSRGADVDDSQLELSLDDES